MPEVTLQPAIPPINPDIGGDSEIQNTEAIPTPTTDYLGVGNNGAKTPITFSSVWHYDTSAIPLGATIDRVKLELLAYETDSGSMSIDFDVLALDERFDQALHRHEDWALHYEPGLFANRWANPPAAADFTFDRICSIRKGVGDFGQAWESNFTGVVQAHKFDMWRSGTTNGLTVECMLHEAFGVPGEYFPGPVLGTSGVLDVDTVLGTTPSATVTFFTTAPASITAGATYMTMLHFRGGSGPENVRVDGTKTGGMPAGTDNAYVVAAGPPDFSQRYLQGFGGAINWPRGSELWSAPRSGSVDTFVAPSVVVDTLYTLSHSGGYAATVSLTNFLANIRSALAARSATSQWIGLRMRPVGSPASGVERVWHSVRSATPTAGGLSGALLTFDYTLPTQFALRHYGRDATPAVSGTGRDAAAAALSYGADAQAAVSRTGGDSHAAVENEGADARPAVDRTGAGVEN